MRIFTFPIFLVTVLIASTILAAQNPTEDVKDLALNAARKAVKKVGIDPGDFNTVDIDSSGHGMDDYLEILRMGPGRDQQSRYSRIRHKLGNREYWVVRYGSISSVGSRSKDGVTVVLDPRTWKILFTFCSLRTCD
jgi:3-hydroxy-3-methylglutaryl CoA synthase